MESNWWRACCWTAALLLSFSLSVHPYVCLSPSLSLLAVSDSTCAGVHGRAAAEILTPLPHRCETYPSHGEGIAEGSRSRLRGYEREASREKDGLIWVFSGLTSDLWPEFVGAGAEMAVRLLVVFVLGALLCQVRKLLEWNLLVTWEYQAWIKILFISQIEYARLSMHSSLHFPQPPTLPPPTHTLWLRWPHAALFCKYTWAVSPTKHPLTSIGLNSRFLPEWGWRSVPARARLQMCAGGLGCRQAETLLWDPEWMRIETELLPTALPAAISLPLCVEH